MSADTTLHTLMLDEMRDLYHAERQLVKALPKLVKAATSPELREALESHLGETEEQVSRLEQAFELLDETAKPKTCHGMLGILEEGSALIKEEDKGAALDAGIIAGAQRAEHYEIAAYGSLTAWAKAMGHNEVAELLSATLDEEKAADEKLSALAEGGINDAATAGEEPEGTESGNGRVKTDMNRGRRRPARMAASGNGRARSTSKPRAASGRR